MIRDATGHVWELTIDLVACRRVRDLVGINLLSMHTARIFSALADPITMAEIVYAIVKPEADRLTLSESDFLQRMAIDTGPVVDQIVRKLSDFFLKLGQPAKATQLTTAMERAHRLAEKTTPEELQRLTVQTFDWMESQIRTSSSGEAATNSQELSELTPTNQD